MGCLKITRQKGDSKMKFKDMKYERIDYDKVEKEAMDLMKRSKEAKS